jgi:hypothetical protein
MTLTLLRGVFPELARPVFLLTLTKGERGARGASYPPVASVAGREAA